MQFEIKHRYTGKVLVTAEIDCAPDANFGVKLGRAVMWAIRKGLSLSGSDLTEANLSGAKLSGAKLTWSDLTGSDLTGSDLTEANLSGAKLSGAKLTWSDLTGSDLTGSDLTGADLTGADLTGADLTEAKLTWSKLTWSDLTEAKLSGSDLTGTDLYAIKSDFFDILNLVPNEVEGLKLALEDGRVDGTVYEGECRCLIGTIAELRHCEYTRIPNLAPNSSRPAERWFMGIAKGDTPEKNPIVKITLDWIKEFQAGRED